MRRHIRFVYLLVFVFNYTVAQAQKAPSVSSALMYSGTSNAVVDTGTGTVILPAAARSIFSETKVPTTLGGNNFVGVITNFSNYGVSQSIVDVANSLNSTIATALSVIPLASPASGVILKKDYETGAKLPVSNTLGPIFTERAETTGKNSLFVGISSQEFHFTKLNGKSLDGLTILYPGGDASNILTGSGQQIKTFPASFNVGTDVRLSQNVAFITYGITNRLDASVGLPVVHSALSARTYNGTIYAGDGLAGQTGTNCWCVNTFVPGSPALTAANIGQSSAEKTGFGDLLLRVKGTAVEKPNIAIGIGTDVRFPTGDETNYLGTGTTSVKPFAAISLYHEPLSNGLIFSPHVNVGWQFSGKSTLGGQFHGTAQTLNTATGPINYIGAPFIASKDNLPDIFSYAVGSEVGFGQHNTVVVDFLGNRIGSIKAAHTVQEQTVQGYSPAAPYSQVNVTGLVTGQNTSFGQYAGAFGYKARVAGNLIITVNGLVRFDTNGLTSRFSPLYGLSYSF